jgi:RNA polymerase sigma-70 factor (ECF subfamily)
MANPPANPLVKALAAGQTDAYAALYDRLGRSLLRVARIMLHGSSDAEDAVQDVFVELVRRRDRMVQVRDLDAYVFAMLRNAVGRRLERKRKEQHHLRQLTPAGADQHAFGSTGDLEAALQSLPPQQREVVALKVDGNLTFAQIAEILNVSPNTAASRYRYAMEKLKRVLE